MNSPPSPTEYLRDELRGDAQKITDAAAERLQGEADTRKGVAADQAKSLSSALDKVAGEMGEDAPGWLKSAFAQGAQSLNKLADTVDQQDSRQLLENVKGFARDNPGSFLAGCAALGFAAARVFKAGEAGASAQGQGDNEEVAQPASGAQLYPASNAAGSGTPGPDAGNRPAVPLASATDGTAPLFQG